MITVKCLNCSKEFQVSPSTILSGRGKYCSRKCQYSSPIYRKKRSEILKGKKHPNFSGEKNYWYGKHHTEETKQKMSGTAKGRSISEKTKLKISKTLFNKFLGEKNPMFGKHHSEEARMKISKGNKGKIISKEARNKISIGNIGKLSGEKHWNWKGGVTPEKLKIRNSIEYTLWRHSVFARDNFTCQKTGVRGGNLIAHHIYNFADYPELRFAIDNGITLSLESHKQFHKIYGKSNTTKEQLEEFLNNEQNG